MLESLEVRYCRVMKRTSRLYVWGGAAIACTGLLLGVFRPDVGTIALSLLAGLMCAAMGIIGRAVAEHRLKKLGVDVDPGPGATSEGEPRERTAGTDEEAT